MMEMVSVHFPDPDVPPRELSVATLKLVAEVLTDDALSFIDPATVQDRARAALAFIDLLHAGGVGTAANLCRPDLEAILTPTD